VNQHALPWLYLRRTIKHLACRDVIQNDRDGFCRVHTCGHWNELALRQADILCVTAADRHSRNRLAQFETRDAFADLIHNANQVPTGRIGHPRCFRMDALARQYVRQAHARGQHLHPDLARHWRRAFLFGDRDHLRSAVARDDDSRVSHEPLAPFRSTLFCALESSLSRRVGALSVTSDTRLSEREHTEMGRAESEGHKL
jgi:hypothetical protein